MASEAVKEFTDSNFETEVLGAETPVLVDFWAEWCQPCLKLAPTIEELASEYDGRVKIGKVDVDSNRDVSVKYGIQGIPTVLIFKGGEIANKIVGIAPKEQFAQALDEAL